MTEQEQNVVFELFNNQSFLIQKLRQCIMVNTLLFGFLTVLFLNQKTGLGYFMFSGLMTCMYAYDYYKTFKIQQTIEKRIMQFKNG